VVGKMQGRLTSRVPGADEINVQPMRGVGFATCGSRAQLAGDAQAPARIDELVRQLGLKG